MRISTNYVLLCLIHRHPDCDTPTNHSCGCSHPFSNAHVIFICDISKSMARNDKKTSAQAAEYKSIKDNGSFNNRLGALYSSIHKFIEVRSSNGLTVYVTHSIITVSISL